MKSGIKIVATLIFLATLVSAAHSEVQFRLWAGKPIPIGDFNEKTVTYPAHPGWESKFAASGEYSFGVEGALGFPKVPLKVVLSTGIVRFDDEGWEVEETTYEFPLGTGRWTDFKHAADLRPKKLFAIFLLSL